MRVAAAVASFFLLISLPPRRIAAGFDISTMQEADLECFQDNSVCRIRSSSVVLDVPSQPLTILGNTFRSAVNGIVGTARRVISSIIRASGVMVVKCSETLDRIAIPKSLIHSFLHLALRIELIAERVQGEISRPSPLSVGPKGLHKKRLASLIDMKPISNHPIPISVRKVSLNSGGRMRQSLSVISFANSTKTLQDTSSRIETAHSNVSNISFLDKLMMMRFFSVRDDTKPRFNSGKEHFEAHQSPESLTMLNAAFLHVYTTFGVVVSYCISLISWISLPFHDTSGVPSVAPHLLLSFIVLIAVCKINQSDGFRGIKWTILITAVVWMYITSIENIQRNRIVYKVESNAFQTMFKGDNDVINKLCESVKKFGGSAGNVYTPLLDLLCADQSLGVQVIDANDDTRFSNFISLFFVNKILASLWTVDKSGGLGRYYSGVIQNFLSYQLQMVPSSIAHLSILDLSVGSTPPVIKAVQVRSYMGECTHTIETDERNDKILEQQRERRIESNLRSFKDKIMHRMNSTKNKLGEGRGNKNNNEKCAHVILDSDFSFSSEDMNIVFGILSTEQGVHLPDAKVTVSRVALAGRFRSDFELLPDFPFIGNSTVGFHSLPELDITVSSFGGIDLSILPGMHGCINMTLSWVLSQFTHPNYARVDILPILCPSCVPSDFKKFEGLTFLAEKMRKILTFIGKHASNVFNSVRIRIQHDVQYMRERFASRKRRKDSNLVENPRNNSIPEALLLGQEIQQKLEDKKFYRDFCELYFLPGGQGSIVHLTVKEVLHCLLLKEQYQEHGDVFNSR